MRRFWMMEIAEIDPKMKGEATDPNRDVLQPAVMKEFETAKERDEAVIRANAKGKALGLDSHGNIVKIAPVALEDYRDLKFDRKLHVALKDSSVAKYVVVIFGDKAALEPKSVERAEIVTCFTEEDAKVEGEAECHALDLSYSRGYTALVVKAKSDGTLSAKRAAGLYDFDEAEQELLKSEKPKTGTLLGNKLKNCTSPSSNAYDPRFDKVIRKKHPEWFNKTLVMKSKLLALPKGAKRPQRRTPEACGLSNYTSKTNRSYDPAFERAVRERFPHWFVNTAEENKKALLALPKGSPRPTCKTKLGSALNNYIGKKSSSYDPVFERDLIDRRPGWFLKTADKNKKALLALPKGRVESINVPRLKYCHLVARITSGTKLMQAVGRVMRLSSSRGGKNKS